MMTLIYEIFTFAIRFRLIQQQVWQDMQKYSRTDSLVLHTLSSLIPALKTMQ